MQPLTFACTSCGKRAGVPAEYAGRKVRCPHCKAVVTTPTAPAVAPPNPAPPPPPVPAAPPASATPEPFTFSAPKPEGAESIFGETEDAEDSLFAEPAPKRSSPPPPTAFAPQEPVAPVPGPAPEPSDGNPFADFAAGPAPPAASVGRTTVEGSEEDEEEPEPPRRTSRKRPTERRPVPWQLAVIVLLAGYSFLATVLAAWGWLR